MISAPNRHPQPLRRLRLAIGTVVTAAFLAACNQNQMPAENGVRALSYGAVSSPIYDALKGKVAVTVSDGSQKPSDYDLLVLDGDAFTGEQLMGEQALHAAIRAGVWVLAFDMEEDDKQMGLGASLNGATPGRSPAYLVRQTVRPDGHQLNTFIDFAGHPGTMEEQARQLMAYVTAHEDSTEQEVSGYPTGLLAVDYRLIDAATQITMPGNKNPVFQGRGQTATWKADHHFSLYMDAKNNPQGDYQHLVVETDGIANPNQLSINNIDNVQPIAGESEIAYLQTMFQSNNRVVPAANSNPTSDQLLTITQTSPQNINNVTNVTTSLNFSVGFSADGGSGSFGYSYSVSKNISDWALTNNTTSGEAGFSFYSQNPYNGYLTGGFDSSAWFYWPYHVAPTTPNTLSLADYEYTTLTHWTNNAVSAGWNTISGTDNAWYTDAWVVQRSNDNNPDGNAPYCVFGSCDHLQHMYRYNVSKPWSLNINMAVVIPVAIKAVTFNPSTVVAGQQTTATVTLAAPTPIPATVYISSDRAGVAAPYGSYVVPAGASSVSFPLDTGAQGDCKESATITAQYANAANGILNITPSSTATCD